MMEMGSVVYIMVIDSALSPFVQYIVSSGSFVGRPSGG